ncbi:MAG: YdbL family protein [Pseudomonadota bacterium]
MRTVQGCLAALLLVFSAVAGAVELDDLKAAGTVGERADGYLGAVSASVSAEVAALVADINGKRRAQYQRIASARGLALDQVEALAGKKTLAKTASGGWIFVDQWQRKP